MRNTQSTPSEPACGRAYTKSVSTKHVSDIFDPTQWDEVQGFSFNDITYHRAKAHGTVRVAFNRPEIRNAFRPATVDELFTALDHARQSSDVGCVLLTGNGPSPKDGGWAFCSGGDQRIRGKDGYKYADGETANTIEPGRTGRLHILEVQRLIRFMPKIVICVVPGWAAGGGHSLHVVSDLTLASKEHARFKQTVEFAAFAEHRGFGRVQVFGRALAEHASAKADALAFDVADREHDAVAKTVVALVFAAVLGVVNHQTAVDQQRVLVIGEDTGQAAPAFGRVAQTESLGDVAGQAAPLQVINGAGTGFQLFAVSLTGFFQHVVERDLALALLGGALAFLRIGFVFGHLHAVGLGQIFHRFDEIHAAVLHQKTDGITVFAAAEAMEKLLARADRKRRRFLAVKRAQTHVIRPTFFQLYIAADHFNHIGARYQLLNERLGNRHGCQSPLTEPSRRGSAAPNQPSPLR